MKGRIRHIEYDVHKDFTVAMIANESRSEAPIRP